MPKNFSIKKINDRYCRQYQIRKLNFKSDLEESGLSLNEVSKLKVKDFKFSYIAKDDFQMCKKIKEFIIKHEWLGKMPHRPTHRFIATYRDKLAGAIVFATPNTFSHILGRENQNLEKLISRGACISWSPKNLASALIMYSIRQMVKNTPYRLFSAYSDPQAGELGTIYQACNFIYLGQNSGSRFKYFDPHCPEKGWFSDRIFRKSTSFKKYAMELDITWQKKWSYRDKIYWNDIPLFISDRLKKASKEHQDRCRKTRLPKKHKYIYILGENKKETKNLCQRFSKLNPQKLNIPYPKDRVPCREKDSIKVDKGKKAMPQKRFYSIKEVSKIYGISQWAIYQQIRTDPLFPHINIGNKKRFLIEGKRFEEWIQEKQQKTNREQYPLPSSYELLEKKRASVG